VTALASEHQLDVNRLIAVDVDFKAIEEVSRIQINTDDVWTLWFYVEGWTLQVWAQRKRPSIVSLN
jgi:hypothetical protein